MAPACTPAFVEGVIVRHSKKPRRGRARLAPADALFERVLLGESLSGEKRFDPRTDRKTLQLCRQVQRALSMALAECGDDLLLDAYVESVESMGGPGQLLVRVIMPAGASAAPVEVMARLDSHAPRLRALLASQICRKRVPTLSFLVVPAASPDALPDLGQEGGDHGE